MEGHDCISGCRPAIMPSMGRCIVASRERMREHMTKALRAGPSIARITAVFGSSMENSTRTTLTPDTIIIGGIAAGIDLAATARLLPLAVWQRT